MELPISAQALTFAYGVLLGLGLCVLYDALRALRQLVPACTGAADVLFALSLGASFLLFALTAGEGQFRLYVFLAVGLAASLYFLVFGPVVVRLFRAAFSLIGKFVQILFAPLCFFLKILKKIFKKCMC